MSTKQKLELVRCSSFWGRKLLNPIYSPNKTHPKKHPNQLLHAIGRCFTGCGCFHHFQPRDGYRQTGQHGASAPSTHPGQKYWRQLMRNARSPRFKDRTLHPKFTHYAPKKQPRNSATTKETQKKNFQVVGPIFPPFPNTKHQTPKKKNTPWKEFLRWYSTHASTQLAWTPPMDPRHWHGCTKGSWRRAVKPRFGTWNTTVRFETKRTRLTWSMVVWLESRYTDTFLFPYN